MINEIMKEFPLGTQVRKKKGSHWRGNIVGYYSTTLTPQGVAIESKYEPGSVQIYPVVAIERY
jgi:dihydrofolate reductase (trimethoprim resistance protein)